MIRAPRGQNVPSGLVALLDDISVIAKAASASIDDIGLAASKAGSKTAGVVIDDAAVTPSYVTGLSPARELPIIWKITKGSLKNKLLILLPGALLLSEFLPQAIILILMLGGAYLSYEGAEKVIEKLGGDKHGKTLEDEIRDPVAFENKRVSGAIRTDLILSAEIMAITLNEVSAETLLIRAGVLAVVAVVVTVAVYGAVGLIVKIDDVGSVPHQAGERSKTGLSGGSCCGSCRNCSSRFRSSAPSRCCGSGAGLSSTAPTRSASMPSTTSFMERNMRWQVRPAARAECWVGLPMRHCRLW